MTRSRFGCRTCRTRRVKCDETLPYCKRCTTTGRRCDGPSPNKTMFVYSTAYGQQPTPATGRSSGPTDNPPPNQLTPLSSLGTSDRRALSFFFERVGPALGGELDQDFWRASVPQLSMHNAMVRNAVLAVSTLYERPMSNPLSWPSTISANFNQPEHQMAFRWYSQSLLGISDILQHPHDQEQMQLALTTCILFACIEFQQLNVGSSLQLMKCGYNLLAQDNAKALIASNPLVRDVLLPMYVRQTIVLMLHGWPVPHGWLPQSLTIDTLEECPITSLQDARTRLFLLMLNAMPIMQKAYATHDKAGLDRLRKVQIEALDKLAFWSQLLDYHILMVSSDGLTPQQTRAISLLRIYFHTTTIWLSACTEPTEMIYDDLTSQFEAVLSHSEILLSSDVTTNMAYSFEMRIIPPLFFVGLRCRIPHLRRQALRLLKSAPPQESLFHRDVEVFTIKKIITIEEDVQHVDSELLEDTIGTLPGEEARLRHVLIQWERSSERNPNINVKVQPHLIYSQWALRQDEDGVVRELKPHSVPL